MDPLGARAFTRAATAMFVAFILFVVLWDLGSRSLHVHDTARWGLLAREMIQGDHWLVPHRYGDLYVNKPPLYLWCVALPAKLAGGVTPFWVRLPSALGFLLLLFATARWTRERLGSRRSARVALLLTLTTPACFWLAREGRLDMMASGLAALGAWQADRLASGRGSRLTPWMLGGILGLALLTKGPPLLIAPLLAWGLPQKGVSWTTRLRQGQPWIVGPVMAAVALAWFVPALRQSGWEEYGRRLLVDQAADRIQGQSTHTHGPLYYLAAIPAHMAAQGVLFLLLALGTLLPRARRAMGQAAAPLAAWLVGVAVFSFVPTKHVRYLPPLVPFAAMGAAHVLLRLRSSRATLHWRRFHRVGAVLLTLAGLGLLVMALRHGEDAPWLVGVPAGAAFLLGVGELRTRPAGGAVLRHAGLARGLMGLALVLVAAFGLRDRVRVPSKAAFVAALRAICTPADRVVTTHHATPESVFHLADVVDHHPDPRTIPWDTHAGRWIVIADQERVAEIESHSGRTARIVARHEKSRDVGLLLDP